MPEQESVRSMRRREIIGQARGLVAEGGLEALTFGALERRVSFTRGVITYHFANKGELVAAVLDSAVNEVERATWASMRAARTPAERLRAVLVGQVEGFRAHGEATRVLIAYWGRIPRDESITRDNAAMFARWRARTAEVVTQGVSEGVFRDVSPDAIAADVVGLVLGLVAQDFFAPGVIDVDAAVHFAADALLMRLCHDGADPSRPVG